MALVGTVNPGNSLGFKNVVINGDMSVWQRGTSFTSGDGIYTADRWYSYRPSITRQSNSDNGGFSLRWTYNSTDANFLSQGIEGVNCVHLRGKTVTLSFEVKTSSNFNSGKFAYDVIENTGTADLSPNSITQSITKSTETTTSFVRVSRTYTLSSSFNNLYVSFTLGSATAGQWYEIRNVQLEEGSVATPFEKRPFSLELQLCQRYFYVAGTNSGGYTITLGHGISPGGSSVWRASIVIPVPLRTTPSITETNIDVWNPSFGSTAINTISTIYYLDRNIFLEVDVTTTSSHGITGGYPAWLQTKGSGGKSTFDISAEL
jgi:hypothetical protein